MSSKDDIAQSEKRSVFEKLPYEPASPSEILAATHIFAGEILTVDATPFTRGSDGLEHRRLSMEIRLREIFKGTLDVAQGDTFRLEIAQRRESELFVTDFHGLWSHLEPQIGVVYLVVSTGLLTSPAALMQERALRTLLNIDYAPDVRSALKAERLFQGILRRQKDDPHLAAVGVLLKLAHECRTENKDVFGRYLWARVGPMFLKAPGRVLSETLEIILAQDAQPELRRSLVGNLYAAVLSLDPNFDIFRRVIRAFFVLVRRVSASQLHDELIEVQLYNLVFKEGQPRFLVQAIFPHQAERSDLKVLLAPFDSDRARKVSSWVASD